MSNQIKAVTYDKMESFKVKNTVKEILKNEGSMELLGMVGNESIFWDGTYALRVRVNRMIGYGGSWTGANWMTRKQAIAEVELSQKQILQSIEEMEANIALLKEALTGE